MDRVFKCVLAALFLFQALSPAVCAEIPPCRIETQSNTQWDELLDSYENICRQCLELRHRKNNGEQISSERLQALLKDLEQLRDELRQVSDKMPAAARARFYAIRKMYSSGVITDTRAETLPAINQSFLPSAETSPSAFSDITVSTLPAKPRPWPGVGIISASVSAPEMAYGISGAYWCHRFGVWGALRSTFSLHTTAYDALSDGSSEGGRIWASGRAATDRLFATAGPVVRITRNLAVFGGAGYGVKRLCWEDNNGDWMLVKDLSRNGVCYELGATLMIGHTALSASWLTLPWTVNTANISIGFCF